MYIFLPWRLENPLDAFTLSPIIMVQWKITLNERKLILEGPIFYFHDYGRNGKSPGFLTNLFGRTGGSFFFQRK